MVQIASCTFSYKCILHWLLFLDSFLCISLLFRMFHAWVICDILFIAFHRSFCNAVWFSQNVAYKLYNTSTLEISCTQITVGHIGFRMLQVLWFRVPYIWYTTNLCISVWFRVFHTSLWCLDHYVSLLHKSLAFCTIVDAFSRSSITLIPVPYLHDTFTNSITCDQFGFQVKLDYDS